MKKLQVLFPEPQMQRLREVARREDRPISEIVRRATEAWLDRLPPEIPSTDAPGVPVFHGGAILVAADQLRDTAYEPRLDGPSAAGEPTR